MNTASPVFETEQLPTGPNNEASAPHRILANLSLSTEDVIGRETEIRLLDAAWNDGAPRIVVLIAPDGMGKTTMLSHWLRQMQADGYRGAGRVVGWSFSSANGGEVTSDDFLTGVLRACGDPAPLSEVLWRKGLRVAQISQAKRTLVILENLDALQYRAGVMAGYLKDAGLKTLLHAFIRSQTGLCVITTTLPIKDLEQHAVSVVHQTELSALSPQDGAQLLCARGVKGAMDEIKRVAQDFDGHPLALTLLGGYLLFRHRGDIRKIDLNAPLRKIVTPDQHVRRVVDAFTIWLQRKPELDILNILGLSDVVFEADRPNAPDRSETIAALLNAPGIKGVTEYTQARSPEDWPAAILRLHTMQLLSEKIVFVDNAAPSEPCRVLDCHPMVRAYFAGQLSKRLPGSWREAHRRLYESYAQQIPLDLTGFRNLSGLIAAVRHGCQAGRPAEAFEDIYWQRMRRTVDALGPDLAVLAHFFMPNWERPLADLPEDVQIRLIDMTALRLETAGRLREAAELVKQSIVLWNMRQHWTNTAHHATNLSRLLLPVGEVEQAVIHARLAWQLSEFHEGDAQSLNIRIRLIRALYLSGEIEEAEQLCQETKALSAQPRPSDYFEIEPFIDLSCCDLLTHRGKYQEAQERLALKMTDAPPDSLPFAQSLEKLIAGKTMLFQAISQQEQSDVTYEINQAVFLQAQDLLSQAIAAFQNCDVLELLIQAVYNRAVLRRMAREFQGAAADLEDLRMLTDSSGMTLYLADYHLESARRLYHQFAAGQGRFSSDAAGEERHQQMHDHVEMAEALIWRTGYHLRDADLTALMTLLKDAIPQQVEEAELATHAEEFIWPVMPPRKRKRTVTPAKFSSPPAAAPQPIERTVPPPIMQPVPPPPSQPIERPAPPPIMRPAPPPPVIPQPAPSNQGIAWLERQERQLETTAGYANIHLYPGEVCIAERPTIVWTVLGSCIAVVLYNERFKFGTICHAQLPEERFREPKCSDRCPHPCYRGAPDTERFKYAACAIRYMYDQFAARGIPSNEITVKLFGGATVLEGVPDTINIGDENVKVAHKVIQGYGLRIVRRDVGGRRGRTLYFYSDTGEVFMKKHRSSEERILLDEGDIDLL